MAAIEITLFANEKMKILAKFLVRALTHVISYHIRVPAMLLIELAAREITCRRRFYPIHRCITHHSITTSLICQSNKARSQNWVHLTQFVSSRLIGLVSRDCPPGSLWANLFEVAFGTCGLDVVILILCAASAFHYLFFPMD